MGMILDENGSLIGFDDTPPNDSNYQRGRSGGGSSGGVLVEGQRGYKENITIDALENRITGNEYKYPIVLAGQGRYISDYIASPNEKNKVYAIINNSSASIGDLRTAIAQRALQIQKHILFLKFEIGRLKIEELRPETSTTIAKTLVSLSSFIPSLKPFTVIGGAMVASYERQEKANLANIQNAIAYDVSLLSIESKFLQELFERKNLKAITDAELQSLNRSANTNTNLWLGVGVALLVVGIIIKKSK